jgi:protein involved in polysaccharide export with SLBB domain
MNLSYFTNWRLLWPGFLPLLAFYFLGCAASPQPNPNTDPTTLVSHLHIGDTVTVTLGGLPTEVTPHEEAIKDDGTITLDLIGPIQAEGKTLGQLQRDIYAAYVPRFYTHLDVAVTTTGDRVYYVQGEVTHPGEELYREGMTVTRAITAAGDFTDFANHKKIVLTRANGQRLKVNCDKIMNGDSPDPIVYPGDRVYVARRLW